MKALWTQDEAGFEGEFVRFPPSWSWPKPVQQPTPPIYLGGRAGPTVFREVVQWADGWMPIGGAGLRTTLPLLRQAAEDAGRDPHSIGIMVFGARPDPGTLAHYRQLGVTRTVLMLPPASADVVLPLLDDWARLL